MLRRTNDHYSFIYLCKIIPFVIFTLEHTPSTFIVSNWIFRNWGFARPSSTAYDRPAIERACIYLQGEMSGSFAVFVWHIRQTLDPTEIRLRVSRCCCPATPGDTCCVSRPFKLQGEPSGAVAGGGIGMLRSWSKLTVEPAREKDTHRAVHMHDPPRTRAYLHPIRCTAPRHPALSVYFLYGPIGNLIIVRASGCQPSLSLSLSLEHLSNYYLPQFRISRNNSCMLLESRFS